MFSGGRETYVQNEPSSNQTSRSTYGQSKPFYMTFLGLLLILCGVTQAYPGRHIVILSYQALQDGRVRLGSS